MYRNPSFTEEEREEMKTMIQTNVYRYLAILLEGREFFEEEIMYGRTQTSQLPSSNTGIITFRFMIPVPLFSTTISVKSAKISAFILHPAPKISNCF